MSESNTSADSARTVTATGTADEASPQRFAASDNTGLTVSRICHDLIGPIAAIRNGLEVHQESEDEDLRAHAMELITNSAESAVLMLRYFRFTYGALFGRSNEIDLQEVREMLEEMATNSKVKLTWECDRATASRNLTRAVMLIAEQAIKSLVRGGELQLSIGSDALVHATARGPIVAIDKRIEQVFAAHDGLTSPEPTNISALYLVDAAMSLGGKVSAKESQSDDGTNRILELSLVAETANI